ncbi:MAG: YicC/YloC family endoribonuclease [Bacteroidota bacterium]
MTGFGSSTCNYNEKTITVSLKSLNGKITDVRCKIPNNYRDKELSLRQAILEKAKRGKIELTISVESLSGDEEHSLNKDLYRRYYKEISNVNQDLGIDNGDIVNAILRIPNVVSISEGAVDEAELKAVMETLEKAGENLKDFRMTEGNAMAEDLELRINNILNHLNSIVPLEDERLTKIKERVNGNLKDIIAPEAIDQNRFEQEVLYYLEKLDITEEKVRLHQHCKYFLEELRNNKIEKGRKLGFITQEMGREMNTIGSKAQFSEIQHIVVQMKDDLEKIKEQVANLV